MQTSTSTTNRLHATTSSRRARITMIFVCVALGLMFANATPASSVPPRPRGPVTGSHRYPSAFESFMVVEFGDLWMHTVQEQVIRRMYLTWQEKQERKD